MAKDWINRHPKLVFLLIGLTMMVLTNLGQYTITSEYTDTLEKTLTQRETKISSLVEENRQLKTSSKTFKIIKPDGTIEEKTETELESSSQISTQVQTEYKEMMEEVRREITESISQNKSLGIYAGITSNREYSLFGTYDVYGPFGIGGGMIYRNDAPPTFMITLGIKL